MLRKILHYSFERILAMTFLVSFGTFMATPVAAQIRSDFGLTLGSASPIEIILRLISWFLGILALIAVVLILYAGFLYLTSRGNDEQINRAKRILRDAFIGLLIILSAWGITLWVLNTLQDITNGSRQPGDTNVYGTHLPGARGSTFYVTDRAPGSSETNVSLCSAIQVSMNKEVNKSTINEETFYVEVTDGAANGTACDERRDCQSGVCENNVCVGDHLPGEYPAADAFPNAFLFVSSDDFVDNTSYHVTLRSGDTGLRASDNDKLNLNDEWFFTTGSETDDIPPQVLEDVDGGSPFPQDNATNVCTNTPLAFRFNESMRIDTFNDTESWVLAYGGESALPLPAPTWNVPTALRDFSAQTDFTIFTTRPAATLQKNSIYGVRLFGGDASDAFRGALRDMCNNPLDGNVDGTAQGAKVDNYISTDDADIPLTWTTGENSDCSPVVTEVTPAADYYGEYPGLRAGSACSDSSQCSSSVCTQDVCVGNGAFTTLTVRGLYLAPYPLVEFDEEHIIAAEGYNTCFDANHVGNISDNTNSGDVCLNYDADFVSDAAIKLRTPVGTDDSQVTVTVAGESSEPSSQTVEILSPYISQIDPDNGSSGQYVTVLGKNFGSTIGEVRMISADGIRSSQVSLPDATICGNTWTDDEIVLIAPDRYTTIDGTTDTWKKGDIGYIQVIAHDTSKPYSNLVPFTFNDVVRPNLCAVEPQCQNAGGAGVTFRGERFGDSQGSSDVVIFAADQTSEYTGRVDQWEDRQIQATTDVGMTQNTYRTTVYDGDTGLNSNSRAFDIPCVSGPQVVNIASCNQDDGIYPTPNPHPNETHACINADIGVLFDQPINVGTLSYGSNVVLEQYNREGSFDETVTPVSVSGNFRSLPWDVTYGSENYQGFKIDVTQSFDESGLIASPMLQPDTWYQLTITTDIQNLEGVHMTSPYILRFKTANTNEPCAVNSINVDPESATHNSYHTPTGDITNTDYTGSPYSTDCQLLDAGSYAWNWSIDKENVGTFSIDGPSSLANESVFVAGADAENEGVATVRAAVGDVSDSAKFTVDFSFCASDTDCNNVCAGSQCIDNRCTPVVDDFDPTSGASGTWVNISGCMFGSRKGNITWNSIDDTIHAQTEWPDEASCGDTWTSEFIIAQVPEQYDSDSNNTRDTILPQNNYTIAVTSSYNQTDETHVSSPYVLNDQTRPGICLVTPSRNFEGADIRITGHTLGTDEGQMTFLSDIDYNGDIAPDERVVAPDNETQWQETRIDTVVANGAVSHNDSLKARDARSVFSNSLAFEVVCRTQEDCDTGICSDAGICVPSSCTSDADCPTEGDVCLEGSCQTPCVSDEACDANERCAVETGMCVSRDCVADTDCIGDQICVDGECRDPGGTECTSDLQCPQGECIEGICTDDTCTSDSECVDPEDICQDGQCETPCTTEADCEGNQYCDASGLCQPGECAQDVDCPDIGDVCLEGTCETSCTSIIDCGEGEYCREDGICAIIPTDETCATNEDCQFYECASTCDHGRCQPYIHELVQPEGPVAAPTSVIGCYFRGFSQGTSQVTFDETPAGFACGDLSWSDRVITVNVPNLSLGDHAVTVTNLYGDTSNSENFVISSECVNGVAVPTTGYPTLCDLNPASGTGPSASGSATTVEFVGSGQTFTPTQTNFFSDNVPGDAFSYTDANDTHADVPSAAVTGPATIVVDSCPSNGQLFTRMCETAEDCGPGGYCTPEGTCVSDACAADCSPGNAESACGPNAGCYFDGGEGEYCCATRPTITSRYPEDNATDICPNGQYSLVFSESMRGVDSSTLVLRNSDGTIIPLTIETLLPNDTIQFYPKNGALNSDTDYQLTVVSTQSEAGDSGIVSDSRGLALAEGTVTTRFHTSTSLCTPTDVQVLSDTNGTSTYTFISTGASEKFTATVYSNSQPLHATSDVSWQWTWSPYYDENSCANVAWVDISSDVPVDINATSSKQQVVAGDVDGEETSITATASRTSETSWPIGDHVQGLADVDVFFCGDDAWKFIDDELPFDDNFAQSFRLLYCADDLPRLDRIYESGTNEAARSSGTTYFREYFFSNPDNEEQTFGVRVYANPYNLPPDIWYQENVPNPGTPTQMEIDGYQAVRDGLSYYVGASFVSRWELSGGTPPKKIAQNYIYLFSFNDEPTLLQIGDEILRNLRFNINVSSVGCDASPKQQLIRDTKRINDLGGIAYYANQYYAAHQEYPLPKSDQFSSYLANLTVSKWISWQGAFGNALGLSLPVDPYNFFYASAQDDPWNADSTPWLDETETQNDCSRDSARGEYYEQETGSCWDPENLQFYCPTNSHTYLWKREESNPEQASIYANLEFDDPSIKYYTSGVTYNPCSAPSSCSCYNYGIRNFSSPGESFSVIP